MTPSQSLPRKPFLLFLRNTGAENYQGIPAEQRDRMVARWNEWFEGLLRQGKAVEGQPLEEKSRLVSGPGGQRVIDGPFAEAKEAIGGYIKLMVADFEEATRIARSHPGLETGLLIEIRELTDDCHLGVVTTGKLEKAAAASVSR